MPLTGLKLFGSTVKNFTSKLGWGTEKGQVNVSLVQDTELGDYFLPPPIGALSNVTFEALNFWGILQKWNRTASPDGLPTYDVTIEDPRSILEGTEIILAGYNSTTYNVPNLINAYGYWENNLGFGGANVNDGGMPWNLIKTAITTITSSPAGFFGGPLTYKGYSYAVDLSQIPPIPSYYRISGSSASLMTIIQQVCTDAGCDFFIDLIPGTTIIRVRTVSRRNQPPTGFIQYLVDNATVSGICKDSQIGLEAINQVTSSFLVGAPVQIMYEAPNTAIEPYFGKDVNGNPILSINTEIGNPYSLTANLNASEVQDILASYSYTCNALEMCCALSNIDTWLTYMHIQRPGLAAQIGLLSPFVAPFTNGVANPKMPQDALNLTPAMVLVAAGANVDDVQHWLTQRMFNFVRKAASEFLGKKFLVQIPFMFTATQPDTGKLVTSYEVASSGYVDTGLPPLGLHPIYKNIFTDTSDMFLPYGRYIDPNLDFSRLSTTDYVLDIYNNAGIYVSINVDPEIIFIDELTPCVAITVNNPLYTAAVDATGAGIDVAAALLQMDPATAEDLFKKLSAGNVFAKIQPIPSQPENVTIPLKSNVLSYGPWLAVGAQGKVEFKEDTTLAPWNYGGFDLMNLTASSRVTEAITFQQYTESGAFELVGAPSYNIGDQLQMEGVSLLGPTITGMQVRYGEGGVTTNYTLQTFTAKFGLFSKDNVERMRKINLKTQELRRETREAFNRLLLPREVTNDVISILGAGALGQWPQQFQRASPHSVFMAIIDEDGDEDGLARVSATTVSDKEIAPSIPADDSDLFDKSAMMSITGLIRPISTDFDSNWLACYEPPNANYKANAKGTVLNPFKSGNDIELYTKGSSYTDAHAYLNDGPGEAVRGFALRGPLVISGWGWSTDDAFVPNGAPETLDGEELDGYLRKSWFWKTGPVDLLWDDERKVWTPHGFMMGKTVTACNAGGSTEVILYDDFGPISGRKKNRRVYNFFSNAVPAERKIMAAWIPEAQKWYIIAADCV